MSLDPDLPAAFYELVGRVVLEAAVLEERLSELAVRMSMRSLAVGDDFGERLAEAMRVYGGQPGTQITNELRTRVRNGFPRQQEQAFQAFLDEVDSSLRSRHSVIHSLWVESRGGQLGWRSLPSRQRSNRDEITRFVQRTDESLRRQLDQLEELVAQADDWRERIPDKL